MSVLPEKSSSPRWIVVADEAVAEFYEQDKKYSPLRKLFALHNDAAQKKIGDLLADRGGRSFDSHGFGRHTMAKEKSGPKTQEAKAFAKQIVARIVEGKNSGDLRDFVLIAAPRFLGLLRKALGTSHGATPALEIASEVAGQEPSVIEKLLATQ